MLTRQRKSPIQRCAGIMFLALSHFLFECQVFPEDSAVMEDAGPFLAAFARAKPLMSARKWSEAEKVFSAFLEEHPDDPFAPLGWAIDGILLRSALVDSAGAKAAFIKASKTRHTLFGTQLQDAARAWLARIQMDELAKKLRSYYLDNVEYPARLDELVTRGLARAVELVDPWGNAYRYKALSLRTRRDVKRQRFMLECARLKRKRSQTSRILVEALAFFFKYKVVSLGSQVNLRLVKNPSIVFVKLQAGRNYGRLPYGWGAALVVTPKFVVLIEGEKIGVFTP